MRMTTAPTVAMLALAAALALAGCTATTPSAGGGTPEGGAATRPGVDLDCAGLLSPETSTAAFGDELASVPLGFDGAGNYYTLSQIGLAQAGALRCEWSDGGASGPERYLTVSVLPQASDDWAALSTEVALYQPLPNEFGDASWHSCSTSNGYSSCRVDALVGDRWFSAVLAGLTGTDAAPAVIEAALVGVADADDLPVAEPAAPGSCDDIAPLDAVHTVLGPNLARVDIAAPVQPVVFHAGFLAAGGTHCSWRNDLGSARALTADLGMLPGGAAAWDAYWGEAPDERVDRQPVDDLGEAAYAGCVADVHCFVSVRTGDDWLQVTVNDEALPDERELAIELARAVLDAG